MTPTIDNLKNLCKWVRRNYPKIAHLTNEDLAIFPLQEWWERDYACKRKLPSPAATVATPLPPAGPPAVAKPPVTKQEVKPEVDPRQRRYRPQKWQYADNNSTDYHMLRAEIAQQRRVAAKQAAHRRQFSASREREWPSNSQRLYGKGPKGSAGNPWQGGKCSPR